MLPLYKLLKNQNKFIWERDQNEAFGKSKEIIEELVKLKIPNPNNPFRIITNASEFALGCVLLQDDQPITYEEKKFVGC